MYWEESSAQNEWVAWDRYKVPNLTDRKICIRLAYTDGNWACRKRKQMGTTSPWTDITADSLEEAQAVAETLYRMGAL